MKYDFLFIYEVKNRELENICLLKCELENRGYTVKIINSWWCEFNYMHRVDANVVIFFSIYGDQQVNCVNGYAKNVTKIANMQWEQVYSISEEETPLHTRSITGKGKEVVHFSWGKKNYETLINKYLLSKTHVCLSGHVAFDFLKPKFIKYYYTRDELFSKYNLDSSKKTFLFLSSFQHVGTPMTFYDDDLYKNFPYNIFEHVKICRESYNSIVDWFDSALSKYSNITLIYRPHPAELEHDDLNYLMHKHNNFKVIRDESVKQWIVCVDKLYNWWSTSITETFVANKPCQVLQPYKILDKASYRIYKNCNYITTKKEFLNSYETINNDFPIPKEDILQYYKIDDDYAYIIIVDKLIEMLNDENYKFNFFSDLPAYTIIDDLLKFFKCLIKRFILNFENKTHFISRFLNKNYFLIKFLNNIIYASNMLKNNYVSLQNINDIQNRIKGVINIEH